MSTSSPPTLLRRAAPAPTATIDTASLHHPATLPRASTASPASPRFTPGFPSPQLSRPDLVAGLFPQLVGIRPDSRPVQTVAEAAGLVRQVSFAVNAVVLEGTPPPPIQGAPRPCLKSGSFMAPGQRLLLVSPSSPARPAADSWRSDGSSGCPEEWRLVRPAYWWRAERSTHQPSRRPPGSPSSPQRQWSRRPPGSSYSSPQRQQQLVKLRDRECHCCLLKGHYQSGCRNPLTCRRCRWIGHKARGCTNPPSPFVPVVAAPLQQLPPPPVLSQPPLAGPMARHASRPLRIGDPSLRPEEGHVVIVATPEMEANTASVETLGSFVWLGGNRPTANAAEIKEAINAQFGIDRVMVVPHYPEDFFALFEFQHHRDRVTASPGGFRHAGLDIHSSNWRRDAHSDVVQANYHIHLCIEGIPLNAWSDSVAAQVLGPDTFVHYFDIATLYREDASCLRLWAWFDNPSSIPKVQHVTFAPWVPNGPGGAPSAAIGHRGFRRRAIVHLDRLEDFTPDANGQVPRRPCTDPFIWIYGVVDGEERPRDPLDPPPRRRQDDDRHRRDDDRDRDDGRGSDNDRHCSSSWRGLFRGRSRALERQADEERRGDRSGDHGHGRDDRD
ncbi:hypothetical protein ACQJBY_064337 [Aegilops geniculata]